jgi:hypothetical protein
MTFDTMLAVNGKLPMSFGSPSSRSAGNDGTSSKGLLEALSRDVTAAFRWEIAR